VPVHRLQANIPAGERSKILSISGQN
jgi:hypothetical protein